MRQPTHSEFASNSDWDLFFNDCGSDLNSLTDVLTSYILFCKDTVTHTKKITIYPNNKKWFTKEMKHCLTQKKRAFLQGDKQKVRELEREFRGQCALAKNNYRKKVVEKLTSGNVREAWQGLNTMMGRATKAAVAGCIDSALFAEELNTFFSRYNQNKASGSFNFNGQTNNQLLTVDEQLVTSILQKVNPYKASGPDRLEGRVLKGCTPQLGAVITRLFQLLLDSGCVPSQWKESSIIPIPKKARAKNAKRLNGQSTAGVFKWF